MISFNKKYSCGESRLGLPLTKRVLFRSKLRECPIDLQGKKCKYKNNFKKLEIIR